MYEMKKRRQKTTHTHTNAETNSHAACKQTHAHKPPPLTRACVAIAGAHGSQTLPCITHNCFVLRGYAIVRVCECVFFSYFSRTVRRAFIPVLYPYPVANPPNPNRLYDMRNVRSSLCDESAENAQNTYTDTREHTPAKTLRASCHRGRLLPNPTCTRSYTQIHTRTRTQ